MVKFYPWFKFYYPFLGGEGGGGYGRLCMIMSRKQKEVKFKPRIKLNHNIYVMYAVHCKTQKAVERWEILLTQDFLPWSHNKKVIFLA